MLPPSLTLLNVTVVVVVVDVVVVGTQSLGHLTVVDGVVRGICVVLGCLALLFGCIGQ